MIQFRCRCKHAFSVADDMAGGVIQCPECAILNDVPGHGDLASLADDGTFRIEAPPPLENPERLAEMAYVFKKGRVDHEGEEIDLRVTEDDLSQMEDGEIPLRPDDRVKRHLPRYDPETGELIRPVEIKPDDVHDSDPRSIPLARPALGYASRIPDDHRISPAMVPIALLGPVNIFVMSFVLAAHLLFEVVLATVLAGIPFLFAVPLMFLFLFVSHYGNVIDEIGPQDKDELPRPLRALSWSEDLWGPYSAVVGAFILSYFPIFFALPLLRQSPRVFVLFALVIGLAGSFVFPAVLLTTTTSGTMLNLRPDRVWGVIQRIGSRYIGIVALFIGSLLVYGTGMFAGAWGTAHFIDPRGFNDLGILGSNTLGLPLLLIGIYLMHLACWELALLYRAYQPQFPWVLQRHEPKNRRYASPRGREVAALADAQRAVTNHQRDLAAAALREMGRQI
jgi:hypothetical protein